MERNMSDVLKDSASGLEFITVGETKNPKHILVVLHGTGDNCQGMEPLGKAFAESIPNTLILIPNGPAPLSALIAPEQLEAEKQANPGMDFEQARNWTGLSKTPVVDEESMYRAVDEIMGPPVKAINTLIDGQLKKYGLTDKDLVVYGFSAGGTMALHSSIRRDAACAGVISHSGHFMGADEAVSKPKVLMIFGDQEMANPQINDLFSVSAEALVEDYGLTVETHVCKNLGHGVNQESFDKACDFAEKSLGIAGSAPVKKPAHNKGPKPPKAA
jgi:predicted esterase